MLLKEILDIRGLTKYKIKLVRHNVNRDYIKKIMNNGDFDLYQSVHKTNIFKGYDYIITFTNLEGTKALLYGVYKVKDVEKIQDLPEEICLIKEPESWGEGPFYKYRIEEVNLLSDLKNRLAIDWGTATRSWHQKKLNKEVIEIFPVGFVKTFPGYQNVILSFKELSRIVNNPDSNRQWKTALSSVYGVYLILDIIDGRQYVGSAYGEEGIWGRWKNYAKTKHGNNKLLIDLLKSDPERYKHFQFSILDILPITSMKEEVINLESITKEKLGSNVFGLNAN